MRKLIPNDITVPNQLAIRFRFLEAVHRWRPKELCYLDFIELRQVSGVRCHRLTSASGISGFIVEDEKLFAWWSLRWV
jgi:hypothetical protein